MSKQGLNAPTTGASKVRPQAQAGERGSQAWYPSWASRADQLLGAGQVVEAEQVFEATLSRLGQEPSYERAAILGGLGRCFQLGGQPGLAITRIREALDVADKLAPREAVRSLQGVLHSDLGEALRAAGQYGEARRAYETALAISRELKDLRAQGVDLGRLGTLALTQGKLDDALLQYRAALSLFQQLPEPAMQAATQHQLGRVFQRWHRPVEAEIHLREAARISQQHGNLAGAAQAWNQLGLLAQQLGEAAAAEQWYRKAIEVDRQRGASSELGRDLGHLADLLRGRTGRLAEARESVLQALAIAQAIDPAGADVWRTYGILGDVLESECAATSDMQQRVALGSQVRDCRELQRQAPRIVTALSGLGGAPSHGRAVILGRLGRCFRMSGRPDLAVARIQEAIDVAGKLAPGEATAGLRGALHSDLAEVLRAAGRYGDAGSAYQTALSAAEASKDLRTQAMVLAELGALASVVGTPQEGARCYRQALGLFSKLHDGAMQAAVLHRLDAIAPQSAGQPDQTEGHGREEECLEDAPSFEITLHEDVSIDYVFDPDLLIDGRREARITRGGGQAAALADPMRPTLVPAVRTYVDDRRAVRFCLCAGEPALERLPGCIVMRRTRREVALEGNSELLWRLIRAMDGTATVGQILEQLAAGEATLAAQMLAALAASGVIDVSGRAIARFVHSRTQKGVMPGGGLQGDDVLRLVTDGNYRVYPEAPRIAVGQSIPERLRAFHDLTRSRRSYRDYRGLALNRHDFDALLHTACGVTGAMSWEGRKVQLRAYPSSGALYAVEVYPVVFRVNGLEPAVYHYRAVDNELELAGPDIDPSRIIAAALPLERQMVAGVAAMLCLVGTFPRHELKYGEGGYRMMVAEAGHISQNLVLAATALGLSARPFGGVFDDLLNQDLGLDRAREQFLLSVLVGHSGVLQGSDTGM